MFLENPSWCSQTGSGNLNDSSEKPKELGGLSCGSSSFLQGLKDESHGPNRPQFCKSAMQRFVLFLLISCFIFFPLSHTQNPDELRPASEADLHTRDGLRSHGAPRGHPSQRHPPLRRGAAPVGVSLLEGGTVDNHPFLLPCPAAGETFTGILPFPAQAVTSVAPAVQFLKPSLRFFNSVVSVVAFYRKLCFGKKKKTSPAVTCLSCTFY